MSGQETIQDRKNGPCAGKGEGVSLTSALIRFGLMLGLFIVYFALREPLVQTLQSQFGLDRATWLIGIVALLTAGCVWIWFDVLASDKRFHAPLLATSILLMGDAGFGILENHNSTLLASFTGGLITHYSPTLIAILTTVLTEMILGRFYFGKWPHLASAYVSGISAGILIKSPSLWPFVLCGMISITSKYVLRINDRHLWNPTNLGVTMMLYLAPSQVASLTVQAGNSIWGPLVIWCLGGVILYQLGRLHIPLAFLGAFLPLVFVRSWWTGDPWLAEFAPITSPMFQLYIFFMITDPKTTTKGKWSQCLVVVLVALVETIYRLAFRDIHSLYHALFTVGPLTNLIEIGYQRWKNREKAQVEARETKGELVGVS